MWEGKVGVQNYSADRTEGNMRCGYDVSGMILLRDLKGTMRLDLLTTCLCMFHLASVMISMY